MDYLKDFSISSKYKLLVHSLVLFVLVIILFLSFVSNCLPINGDAAAYNQQIEDINLRERTVHWGFIAVGILFTRMMPFPIDLSMNILAALLGAVGTSVTFLICYKLTESVLASYFSAAILLSSKTFFGDSVFTNIYQAQTVFILLAVFFWLYQKSDILAAMFFLVAQLINPTTVVAIPLFFLDSFSYKRIAKGMLYIIPVYGIFLYVYWNDFWYSSRGILGVTSFGIYHHFPFFWRLRDNLYHILYDLNFIIIFIVLGSVWILYSRNYLHIRFVGLTIAVFLGLVCSAPDNWFPKMQMCFPWLAITGGILFMVSVHPHSTRGLENLSSTQIGETFPPPLSPSGGGQGEERSPGGRNELLLFTRLRNVSRFKHKHVHSIFLIVIGTFLVFSIYRNGCNIYKNKISNELFKTLCKDVNGIIKKDFFVVSDWSKGVLYERYNFHAIYTGKVVYRTQPDFEITVLNKNICILDQKTKGFIHEKFKIPLKEVRLQSGIVWFNKKIN